MSLANKEHFEKPHHHTKVKKGRNWCRSDIITAHAKCYEIHVTHLVVLDLPAVQSGSTPKKTCGPTKSPNAGWMLQAVRGLPCTSGCVLSPTHLPSLSPGVVGRTPHQPPHSRPALRWPWREQPDHTGETSSPLLICIIRITVRYSQRRSREEKQINGH